jgi:hypothetical protein
MTSDLTGILSKVFVSVFLVLGNLIVIPVLVFASF